jgi:hypothetical protein
MFRGLPSRTATKPNKASPPSIASFYPHFNTIDIHTKAVELDDACASLVVEYTHLSYRRVVFLVVNLRCLFACILSSDSFIVI